MKLSKRIIIALSGLIFFGFLFIGYISHGFAAGGYRLLQWTSQNQYTALSNFLLTIGAPPSPYKEIYDWDYRFEITDTPLHWAAKSGDVELARSLIEHGAIIDWCCCSCVTPLHQAILNKQPEIVELLLQTGADTHIFYDSRLSVLELARTSGSQEIMKLILAHNDQSDTDTGNKCVLTKRTKAM